MTKDQISIADLLIESYIVPESIFDKKRTKTSHFLLNTIFSNSSIASTECFINAFLGDDEHPHAIKRPLFILFKVGDNDNKWATIAPKIRSKAEYLWEYIVGTHDGKNLLMMVFQIPDKYSNEYVNFKLGKYSHFSAEYKKLFNRYAANEKQQPVESTIWRVLYRSPELRRDLETYFGEPVKFDKDDELWGIPEDKYEIYRYKQK